MKKVDYTLVKELARLTRKYADNGDTDILLTKFRVAEKMSYEIYGTEHYWSNIVDLFGAICGVRPMKPDCTDDEIIQVLRILDIETVKE